MLKYCNSKANKHNQISNKLLLFTEKSKPQIDVNNGYKFNHFFLSFYSSLLDVLYGKRHNN